MECSKKLNGGNGYKIPRLYEKRVAKAGKPLTNIVCAPAIYNLAENVLRKHELSSIEMDRYFRTTKIKISPGNSDQRY